MRKIIILLAVFLTIISCKGPGSGPLVKESFTKTDQKNPMGSQTQKVPVVIEKVNVAIEPCTDCITIAKLFADKKSYSGKVVKIKGQVTKFNPEIMGKNWVHIQDGSEFEGGFDLTVTTNIKVVLGEIVTFEGKIALDKDFGYGYFYNVLMEEAKPVNK